MGRKLFVYGTLKQNEVNHYLIEHFVKSIQLASTRGWIYDLGEYPAMISGNGIVEGELIEFNSTDETTAFEVINMLKGVFPDRYGIYERICVPVKKAFDGEESTCEVYLMLEKQENWLSYNFELIPDGIWPCKHERRTLFYFAYGSCMNRSSFAKTISNYDLIGRAIVLDQRVVFSKYSNKWGGGIADLIYAKGYKVEGVLYRIPVDKLPALDKREGADNHLPIYRRIPITVFQDRILITAITYEVVSKFDMELMPHLLYLETILEGTDLLSREYVQELLEHAQSIRQESLIILLEEDGDKI